VDGPSGVQRWSVDRREADVVVVRDEAGRVFDLPRWALPAGIRDGDVLAVTGTAAAGASRLEIRVDAEATAAAARAASALLARHRSRDPGGPMTV
jgi:hypothetical protein